MSARAGFQPDVLRGQDSGASSDSPFLAAALVPWYPGPGTCGNFVHHHHLHPEVRRAYGGVMLLSLVNAYTCGTHANGCVNCSGSVLGLIFQKCGQQPLLSQSEVAQLSCFYCCYHGSMVLIC